MTNVAFLERWSFGTDTMLLTRVRLVTWNALQSQKWQLIGLS